MALPCPCGAADNPTHAVSEVHCVFENASDANRVSEALQAGVVGRYPGWASQREFTLDGMAIRTIERALREVK